MRPSESNTYLRTTKKATAAQDDCKTGSTSGAYRIKPTLYIKEEQNVLYIWIKNTPYGWHFSDENNIIWRWYYGYTKREAIKKFREDFNLKYKKIHFIY